MTGQALLGSIMVLVENAYDQKLKNAYENFKNKI